MLTAITDIQKSLLVKHAQVTSSQPAVLRYSLRGGHFLNSGTSLDKLGGRYDLLPGSCQYSFITLGPRNQISPTQPAGWDFSSCIINISLTGDGSPLVHQNCVIQIRKENGVATDVLVGLDT
jgi:hypothetical protein